MLVSALTLVKFCWVANIMENSFMKRVKIQSCHQSFCAFGIAYVKAVCKHISEIDPCWHNCWSIYLCKSSTPKLQIALFIFPWHSLSYQSEQRTICWVENDFDLFKFFYDFLFISWGINLFTFGFSLKMSAFIIYFKHFWYFWTTHTPIIKTFSKTHHHLIIISILKVSCRICSFRKWDQNVW